jgi:hypothetical protein
MASRSKDINLLRDEPAFRYFTRHMRTPGVAVSITERLYSPRDFTHRRLHVTWHNDSRHIMLIFHSYSSRELLIACPKAGQLHVSACSNRTVDAFAYMLSLQYHDIFHIYRSQIRQHVHHRV